MIRCDACNRHIFARETACPFCATALPRLRSGLLAAGLVVLAGCAEDSIDAPVSPLYGIPAPDIGVSADATPSDAGLLDSGRVDAGLPDLGPDVGQTDAALVDGALVDGALGDAIVGDALPADMTTEADMAADMTQADQAVAPDMQADMFIALPPYGIPPEPERDPE